MRKRPAWPPCLPMAAQLRRSPDLTRQRSATSREPGRGALIALVCVGLVLSGCGQAGSPAASAAVTSYTSLATVDSGAFCIPDLDTTHISLVPLQPGGATGGVSSTNDAQQVREGAVPAPPNSRLVTQGRVISQAPISGPGSPALTGQMTMDLYETSCSPGDVQAYYVAVLLQNQWSGAFVPASGAAVRSVSAGAGRGSAASAGGAAVTLFDLAALTTGRFVNVHPKGDAVVFITALAAIEAPGTPQERHPTYVQLILQPSASTAATPTLPPSAATTPNVGASAAPPGGETAP
jgi:hypothetical protein